MGKQKTERLRRLAHLLGIDRLEGIGLVQAPRGDQVDPQDLHGNEGQGKPKQQGAYNHGEVAAGRRDEGSDRLAQVMGDGALGPLQDAKLRGDGLGGRDMVARQLLHADAPV